MISLSIPDAFESAQIKANITGFTYYLVQLGHQIRVTRFSASRRVMATVSPQEKEM